MERPQTSFTSGEISPSLYGRVDFVKYFTGLKTCRNFIPLQYGGVQNRPGTHFVATAYDQTHKVRLISFQYSASQQYVLEFGHGYMRVLFQGSVINIPVQTNHPITDITAPLRRTGSIFNLLTPMQVTCPNHGFNDGDVITIDAATPTQFNGSWTVAVRDSNTLWISDYAWQSNTAYSGNAGGIAQASYPDYPGAGGEIVVITPYDENDLPLLKFVQSADVLTICHQSHQPQQVERIGPYSWQMIPFVNTRGPFQELNVDESKTITASAVSGTVTLTASSGIFTPSNIGQLLYIEQMPDNVTSAWEVQVGITINEIRKAGSYFYQAVNSGTTGAVRPTVTEGMEKDGNTGVTWLYLHSGFGLVQITGVTDGTTATATVISRLPELVTTGSFVKTITNVVTGTDPSEGVLFSPCTVTCPAHGFTTGSSVTIAGVLGAVEANGVHQIIVIDANNFNLSDIGGTSAYISGGTATATFTGSSPTYKWAFEAWKSDQLYPMTTGYFQQRQLFAATPPQPQMVWFSAVKGYNDFSTGVPLMDDDAMTYEVFATQINEVRHIIETTTLLLLTAGGPFAVPSGQNTPMTPTTVSFRKQGNKGCSHLRPLEIDHFALFTQDKGYAVNSIGYSFQEDAFTVTDLTLFSDHLFRGYTIVDWCFQDSTRILWAVRDDGILLTLTFLPEQQIIAWARHDTAGSFESVCCVTENGKDVVYCVVNRPTGRFVEQFDARRLTDLPDAYFLDCGLSYNGEPATSFSGLDHLEGMTVSVLADGIVLPPQVVTSGVVTLSTAASVVHIGLSITADFETLEIKEFDKKKIINNVSLMVQDTPVLYAGPDPSHLMRAKELDGSLFTGETDLSIPATWQKPGRIFVRQTDPLPITILAVVPDVTLGGR